MQTLCTEVDDSSKHSIIFLVYSEDETDQRRCLGLYLTHGPDASISFARAHLDVIQRFGRFPSCNEALGCSSTSEEKSFLALGGVTWEK